MRKIVLIAGLAALAACSKPAEVEPVATEAAAAAAATPSPVAAAGTYQVTDKDKKQGTLVIAADNTYTFTNDAGTAKGTVEVKDGKGCYDSEGDKDPVVCWTNSEPGADGTWTATSDDGQTVSVARTAS